MGEAGGLVWWASPLSVGLPGGLWLGGAECTMSSNNRGNWRTFEWPKDVFLEEEKNELFKCGSRRDKSAAKLYFLYRDDEIYLINDWFLLIY